MCMRDKYKKKKQHLGIPAGNLETMRSFCVRTVAWEREL